MSATVPFKRLILRAVLRGVSPMVARLLSVSDDTALPALHEIFQQVLGWRGQLGYAFRVHGQEFNRFRRRSRSNITVVDHGFWGRSWHIPRQNRRKSRIFRLLFAEN